MEDNDDYYVKFDPNTKQNNQIITSIFRKLTGRYTIFSAEAEQDNHEFFCYVTIPTSPFLIPKQLNKKYGESMQKNAEILNKKEEGKYITYLQWDQMFKEFDEDITKSQRDYLLCKLFEKSKNLDKLSMVDFNQMFTSDDIDFSKFEKKDQGSEMD